MPAHPKALQLEDYLTLIRRCKERALADVPILPGRRATDKPVAPPPYDTIVEHLSLSEQEQKIVSFLRLHRTANERELRTLLGTRRVAGIVNRLVQKTASQGISLIAKKGMGEDGEVYEYIGS